MSETKATCAMTGKTEDLVMHAHRNKDGQMVGWVYLHEEVSNRIQKDEIYLTLSLGLFDNSHQLVTPKKATNGKWDVKTGIELIAEERIRQIEKEGWTSEHDSKQVKGELALAAACYAIAEDARNSYNDNTMPSFFPWEESWWKPSPDNRIRELQKAGALIAAEIDRLQKLKQP